MLAEHHVVVHLAQVPLGLAQLLIGAHPLNLFECYSRWFFRVTIAAAVEVDGVVCSTGETTFVV